MLLVNNLEFPVKHNTGESDISLSDAQDSGQLGRNKAENKHLHLVSLNQISSSKSATAVLRTREEEPECRHLRR